MQIRRATVEDADVFAEVIAAVAGEGRWIGTEAPVDVGAFADRVRGTIQKGSDTLWLLEDDDGRVIGTLGLHGTPAKGVALLGMCILQDARGRGGGHAMMRAAIAHARAGGLHKIDLEVWPDNARAIALYESYGFELEGTRRRHYRRRDGTLRDSLLMALLLDDDDQSRPDGGT